MLLGSTHIAVKGKKKPIHCEFNKMLSAAQRKWLPHPWKGFSILNMRETSFLRLEFNSPFQSIKRYPRSNSQ